MGKKKELDIKMLETFMSKPHNKTQEWVAIKIFEMTPEALSAWLKYNKYKKLDDHDVKFVKVDEEDDKSGPD